MAVLPGGHKGPAMAAVSIMLLLVAACGGRERIGARFPVYCWCGSNESCLVPAIAED